MSNEENQSRWKVVPESEPNFEGTELGKMLEGLKKLQAHYEGELQKDLETLAVLQQGLAKWELQKKKRKVDPNG